MPTRQGKRKHDKAGPRGGGGSSRRSRQEPVPAASEASSPPSPSAEKAWSRSALRALKKLARRVRPRGQLCCLCGVTLAGSAAAYLSWWSFAGGRNDWVLAPPRVTVNSNPSAQALPRQVEANLGATAPWGAAAEHGAVSGCTLHRGYANSNILGSDHYGFAYPDLCMRLCSDQGGECTCWTWKDDGFCRIGTAATCTYLASEDDDRWVYGACPPKTAASTPELTSRRKEGLPVVTPSKTSSMPLASGSRNAEPAMTASLNSSSSSSIFGAITLSRAVSTAVLPVLLVTHARAEYLQRALASILKHRDRPASFPIFASQDGDDAGVERVLQAHLADGNIVRHLRFRPLKTLRTGYERLCEHYKWAFSQLFDVLGSESLVVLEEDMEIAPDLFTYFEATLPLLKNDPALFCVSAWNDNGKPAVAADANAVYRTDFFPGLGWMLLRGFWHEVRERWPKAYWDDFIRHPDVRKGRHCLRPEVSRTHNFGAQGVSRGQFFKDYLAENLLHSSKLDWSKQNLSHLSPAAAFDAHLTLQVAAAEIATLDTVTEKASDSAKAQSVSLKIQYTEADWKRHAKFFGLMEDEKAGIHRGFYRGVFPFTWRGRKTFLFRDWP